VDYIVNFTFTDSLIKRFNKSVDFFKSLYAEYYPKYLEYYRAFRQYLRDLTDLDYASYSYIPFLGWVIPLVLRRDNSFCMHHAKQGFVFFIMFVVAAVALNLLNIFAPREDRILRLCIVILIYAMYLAYIVLCVIAVKTSRKGMAFNPRPLYRFADMIDLSGFINIITRP